MKGLLVKKIGMTRMICPDTGKFTPVTLLLAPINKVLQVKTSEIDGYDAVVLAAFERKKDIKNVHRKYKAIEELCGCEDVKKGDELTVDFLDGVESVKITGTSKGRGFAGVIKRHNFSRGPETHGSHHHREPGSVGMCAKPGRVLKGKKMPGHYGNVRVTLRAGKVMSLDKENQLIAVKGAVPGPKGGFVFVRGS